MFKNYLLVAFRNLKKQKSFSLINIFGLTLGISCCLLIFLFIMNEFSFDRFHTKGDRIYRVMRVGNMNGNREEIPYLSGPYAAALKNDFGSDIEATVRVMPSNGLIESGNQAFNEKKLYIADPNFFEVFDFKLIKGDPKTVLKDPTSIVLSEAMAKKYFGNQDPMGQVVRLDKDQSLKVTGVMKNVPVNSHLDFDLVIPLSLYASAPFLQVWNNNNNFTYALLAPNVKPEKLTAKFPAFMQKYMPTPQTEVSKRMTLDLNPLHDIYFEPAAPWDNVKHGSRNIVFIFLSIALMILGLACINFMNLATAKASDRSKEVGLRKVLGAVKSNLVYQFLGESFLLAAISAVLAVLLVQLVTPSFNQFLGYTLPVFWQKPAFYVFIPVVIIVVGILAGIYPALVLSSFSPIESLKGKLRIGKAGAFFRKGLVVFQFGISVLLIFATMVIMLQMNFVRATDLGFNQEQSLVMKIDNNDIYNNSARFRTLVKAIPNVTDASLMSGEPGGFYDNFNFDVEGKEGDDWMFRTVFTDLRYVSTLGLKIVAGRNLSESFPTDSASAVLINQKTASRMGLSPEQAIGKRIRNQYRDSLFRTIVGVVEDFHFLSLKDEIQPLVISPGSDVRVAVIRLAAGDPRNTISQIKKIYTGIAPVYPFEYSFLDESFDVQYKADVLQQDLLKSFAIVGILIACLGLFGLASFTAVKRTKEIGVRKVLGSSIEGIVVLLSKDLLKPVLIGTILAIPIGYLVMRQWLENFAYRTPIYWWIYVVAVLVSLVIALLTVSQQAFKAALSNPAKSLRTE